MKKLVSTCIIAFAFSLQAEEWTLPSGQTLHIDYITDGALRVTVGDNPLADKYIYGGEAPQSVIPAKERISYSYNPDAATVTFTDGNGLEVKALLAGDGNVVFTTPADEHLYGTGQFQDGYLDIKGLTRRLTQVNTQISIPMILSNKGYGILWNNCGITEFNPGDRQYILTADSGEGETVDVDATSTAGNVKEKRHYNAFTCDIDIDEEGDYAFLLDVGQQMARKHYLAIDGQVLTEANNVWLPPTTSVKAHLTPGKHHVEVRGEQNDRPVLHSRRIDDTTTFRSEGGITDFTIFAGNADRIVADMRSLTGQAPMLPKWALGYVHCRERYTSQDDILQNAATFRQRGIPVDVIVQDWQWWGDNGWNAMRFDQKNYPDPKALTDSLHTMDIRMMLSVWAKVDKNSELGKELEAKGSYIPGTDWIDFFSENAAEDYWQAYRDNLVPTGIDSWWQDATEPENDDLHGRIVGAGTLSGDAVRNVFPIVVNDRVYRGLREERPDTRPLILTRSAAPGLQRYGAFTWSGDVGNDWQTLQRQISGGLGQMAAGLPWWTYDAGGFFRPSDQYTDLAYQERMVRWIQNSVYLPMMRVHGYMSRTEPWHYSKDTYRRYLASVKTRYAMLPYIYSEAAKVSRDGYTLMRPFVFDFPSDEEALRQNTQYMLGSSILVCPITDPGNKMKIYLPYTPGGWCNINTAERYEGGGYIEMNTPFWFAPAFARAGSIIPLYAGKAASTADITADESLYLAVTPGADGEYTIYDDGGLDMSYADGNYCIIRCIWNDADRTLTIGDSEGLYPYKTKITATIPGHTSKEVDYKGKEIKIQL